MSHMPSNHAPSLTPRSAGEGTGQTGNEVGAVLSAPSLAKRGRIGVGANACLAENTASARLGLKGPGAADWLQSQGIVIPDTSNTWRELGDDSSLIARLGSTEFFVEQPAPAGLIDQLARALRSPIDGVYLVLREDRAFVLEGSDANDVLAQVCNIDFKSVSRSKRHLVMTMMIGVAVLVIPQDSASNGARSANGGCYRIWCDPTYGDYLWSSLQRVISGA